MQLDKKRGSLPRCLLMMDGNRETVAKRLTDLVNISGITVSPNDIWMPYGKPVQKKNGEWDKTPASEAQLAEPNPLLPDILSEQLKRWWLAVLPSKPNTPNWDIASTCTVHGTKGLLLIEGKAHDAELRNAEKGKNPDSNADNHERIGQCIEEANRGFSRDTGVHWNLSRDSHYQMSNRFAWSWKLTQLEYPIVLVYLGFLNANEMGDQGEPFTTFEHWEQLVHKHSAPLFPEIIWRKEWIVNQRPLVPLIRIYDQPLAQGPSGGKHDN